MWVWFVVGAGSFLGMLLMLGLLILRVLDRIGREISELQEADQWATLPPSRAPRAATEQASAEESRGKPAVPAGF